MSEPLLFIPYGDLTLIRLHVSDPEGGLLTDDQINAVFLDRKGNIARTVADLLRVIAASEVLVSKKIRTQDLQTDGPAVSAELRALAREWDARADAEEGIGGAHSGFVPGPSSWGDRYEGEEARTWWG